MSEKLDAAVSSKLTNCGLNAHILNDCGIAGPAGKGDGKKQASAAEHADSAPATPPAAKSDALTPAHPPSKFGTEEQFMHYAPKMYREAMGLPDNASSQAMVEKYMGSRVEQFQKQPDSIKKSALESFKVDQNTIKHVLAHDKDATRLLTNALLDKERDWLHLPHEAKPTPASFKKLEEGILRDDYQAVTGAEKIWRFSHEK